MDKNDAELIGKLESALKTYDKIMLIVDDQESTESLNGDPTERSAKKTAGNLTEYVVGKTSARNLPQKTLILSHTADDSDRANFTVKHISDRQEETLLSLYRLYDFSDRFTVLMNDSHYGNILNYVESGILTWDEAIDACLRR